MSAHQLNRRHEPQARELAARESNGMYVRLLWNPAEDALTVEIDDDWSAITSKSRSLRNAP